MSSDYSIDDLQRIMAQLRDPHTGCPWDTQQHFESIAPYTIEETYEVVDAIDRRDYSALCEELGDLLLQVMFHSRLAEEQGYFDFSHVVNSICDKMIRRHPHVFGTTQADNAQTQQIAWEDHKRQERQSKSLGDPSLLGDIPSGLPEWQRALKLQKRAATAGFDWPSINPVFEKLYEELEEVQEELAKKDKAHSRLVDEIGDVLFVCVNLARHAKVDISQALRMANRKFERRFRRMEELARATGTALENTSFETQDSYWEQAKKEDKLGLLKENNKK